MADASAYSAYLTLIPKIDDKGINKEVANLPIEGGAVAAGEKLGTGLAKGVAMAAAAIATAIVAAVGVGVKQSLDAFAEYEQLFGGIESVFKGNEDLINQVADTGKNAWKDLTMSENEYYQAFMSAYPLIKASLDDANAAIEQTNRLLTLEADLANTFGYSTAEAATAINWALKGSYNYLDNLNIGIKGTQEGFLEAANASGLFAEEIRDLDELTSEDKIAVIEHYADQYGVLGKTSQEAASTIQGSSNMMKASWTNLMAGIAQEGADIEALVGDLVESIVTWAGNVLPRVLQIIEGLFQAAPALIEQLMPELLGFIQQLVEDLPQIVEAGMTCIAKLIEGLAEAMPTMIPTIVQCVVEIAEVLTRPDNLMMLINAALQLILAIAQGLVQALPQLIEKVPLIIQQLNQAVLQAVPLMLQAGIQLVAGVAAGIANAAGKIGQALLNACKQAWNQAKSWLGIASPSKLFADTIGEQISAGIGVGIEANANAAIDPAVDVAKATADAAAAAVHGSAGSVSNTTNNWNVTMTAMDAREMQDWADFERRAEAKRIRIERMG